MKTITKYPLLFALMGLAMLAGCKKHKKNDITTNNKPTNPITVTAVCDYDVSDTALTNHGWTKAFDDEFSGTLSNWTAITGGVEKELECNEPANAQIVNGVLQITAKQQTVTGPKTVGNDTTQSFNYTSAWLVSNMAFSANVNTPKVRIVARIKVASGYGLTSLFYGFGGNWPTNGEIDYMGVQGNDTKEYATTYDFGTQVNKNEVSGALLYNPTTEDLSACYHIYTMEWTQSALNSYLDGKLVEAKTAGGHVGDLFGKSHTLALSLPIGGLYYSSLNTANVQGGTLYVDYVKVFTSN
ncbi:MAG TPA: glycoside hydrolase family 16 protein [Mucilaginibacter sp.]|jgi:beta-glucanase (GH16 family)|nr:glycoside hydrolase family 16 protein [Mucilaginibacter sp.]